MESVRHNTVGGFNWTGKDGTQGHRNNGWQLHVSHRPHTNVPRHIYTRVEKVEREREREREDTHRDVQW